MIAKLSDFEGMLISLFSFEEVNIKSSGLFLPLVSPLISDFSNEQVPTHSSYAWFYRDCLGILCQCSISSDLSSFNLFGISVSHADVHTHSTLCHCCSRDKS